ncbi:MAG: protein kinase [Polyangiales bacterium]
MVSSPHDSAARLQSAAPDEVLPRRFGKYTLLRRMATGGMAELYLALHRSVAGFEKLIVIKRILPAMTRDRSFIDMLLHEARVAATLSHPNIVQTIDVGQVDGTYFIALEHIHGEDLRSIVRQMRKRGVVEFPVEHAIAIVLGICAGLSYAHERKDLDGTALEIVHRDISPQNVLVGFAGDVKIVDFGVAKSGTQTGEQTRSGQLKGKVPYMSPEQARGESIDLRSDIFAVGVLLFELTTGRRLFKGASEFETLKLILEKDYPRPSWVNPDYPPALEAIVMKALEKNVANRYSSAREMQSDLEAFVRDQKLPVSSIALAEFMKGLFEEKLAAQKEALMHGRALADIIANEIAQSERSVASDGDTSRISSISTAAAAGVAGSVPPTPTGPPKWLKIAVPAGALALILIGVLIVKSRGDPSATSSASEGTSTETSHAKAKARLVVKSVPAGAHVWVNGEARTETTPATLEDLPSGTVDVKVTLDGYVSKSDHVDLRADSETTRNFTLEKGAMWVELTGLPAGASATLDGKVVTLPKFEAEPGESHTLVVSAVGFATKTLKVKGDLGEVKKLDVGASKGDATPSAQPTPTMIATPPTTTTHAPATPPTPPTTTGATGKMMVSASGGWCNVTIDGGGHGATPIGAVELSAGNHSVVCTDADGKAQRRTVSVTAGETTRVKFAVE